MTQANNGAAEKVRSFVERIERLNDEKSALSDDLKAVYAEAKATGLDTKALRAIIKLRKMDRADIEEQTYYINLYAETLGMYQIDLFGAGELDNPDRAKEVLIEGFKKYVRQNPDTDITIRTDGGELEKITAKNAHV